MKKVEEKIFQSNERHQNIIDQKLERLKQRDEMEKSQVSKIKDNTEAK